ncbi:hypothetical protein RvY_02492 [Ramazzottius varieornatus]|uniref:Uncharacterized protein n=1 Tax=Ramazzottius varieornatus TaxID=947166 RepID=A0A1D1UNA6_RAMVA|nr:hypothetical protein RvY_02492 [Ramazzottius varieornatus]
MFTCECTQIRSMKRQLQTRLMRSARQPSSVATNKIRISDDPHSRAETEISCNTSTNGPISLASNCHHFVTKQFKTKKNMNGNFNFCLRLPTIRGLLEGALPEGQTH